MSHRLIEAMPKSRKTKQTVLGIEDETGRLIDANGNLRSPGSHPVTGEYDTAQMLRDEMFGGDPNQPLFD